MRGKTIRLGVIAAVLLGALVLIRLLSGPSAPLEDAEAAGFADELLLADITAVADSSPDRTKAVAEALTLGDAGSLATSIPYAWDLIEARGKMFSIASYYYWDDRGSFWSGARWGKACRSYEIGATDVTIRTIHCPSGTSDSPLSAISG